MAWNFDTNLHESKYSIKHKIVAWTERTFLKIKLLIVN